MSNQPALPLAQPGQQPAPRVAPHNLEAEQALLGAILFDNETMNRITTLLKEQHFYDPVHGRIFATCQDMIAAGQLADGVTLREKFSKDGGIKEIGGALYLMKLLESADVLIENFKPGTLDKWGIGNDVLRQKFPRLVHCRISGFGADGPRGGNPGYDAIIQAMAGMIAATGSQESGPMRIGVPVVDITTGLYACIGILMALSERQRSGLGQFLETTLYETGLAVMHPHAANYFMHGKPPSLTGNEHPNLVPYATFPTKTDNIFIGVGNDGTFRKLAKEIGKPELGTDPRFARNKDRIANREALRAELAAVFSQHEAEPLCNRLLAAGLPAGPVQKIDQALTNAHTIHRGDIIAKDWYKGVASPIRMDRTKASLRRTPPKFSQHTAEVLGEFGYSKAEVEALVAKGVVCGPERKR